MNYIVRGEDGQRVVDLIGHLTFEATDGFRDLLAALEEKRTQSCVLNLEQVEFIDSAGLGLLVLANATARRNGMTLSMRSPRGQVREMIEVAEFHTIIPCDFN